MKECILITSYCDDQQKVDALIKTIKHIRRHNIDILLHAHYPIDVEIQKLVNHYIFASDNPINNTKYFVWWKEIDSLKMNFITKDHTYTALKQFKEGLLFLKSLSYDIVHVLNYDTYVDDNLFKMQSDLVKSKGSVFYKNFEIGRAHV